MTDKPEIEADAEETPVEAVVAAKKVSPRRGGLAVGAAAVGIGSAALVAALLYARRKRSV